MDNDLRFENVRLYNKISELERNTKKMQIIQRQKVDEYKVVFGDAYNKIRKIDEQNRNLALELNDLQLKYNKIPKIIRKVFIKGE